MSFFFKFRLSLMQKYVIYIIKKLVVMIHWFFNASSALETVFLQFAFIEFRSIVFAYKL